jgi:tripartite-type tricarboxylate transporter receptor subunit TctC
VYLSSVQLPLVRTGRIKAFAVISDKRLVVAPDIPTFAELGWPSLTMSFWFGLFAPKGTPNDIIGKLNAAAVEALADPTARSRLFISVSSFFLDQRFRNSNHIKQPYRA